MKLLVTVCSLLAICLGQNQQLVIPEQPLFPTRVPFRRYTYQQCSDLFYGCKDACYEQCMHYPEDQSRYFDESLGRHDLHSYCKSHCAEGCLIFDPQCQHLLREQLHKDHEKDTRRYTSKNSKVISLEVPSAPKPILTRAIRNTSRQSK